MMFSNTIQTTIQYTSRFMLLLPNRFISITNFSTASWKSGPKLYPPVRRTNWYFCLVHSFPTWRKHAQLRSRRKFLANQDCRRGLLLTLIQILRIEIPDLSQSVIPLFLYLVIHHLRYLFLLVFLFRTCQFLFLVNFTSSMVFPQIHLIRNPKTNFLP